MHDGSVEAFVGNQQVGASTDNQDGFACGVCGRDCFDNFCFGGGADVGLSGAAYLGGGQFAQQLFSHRLRIPSLCGVNTRHALKSRKPYGDFAFIFRRTFLRKRNYPAGKRTKAVSARKPRHHRMNCLPFLGQQN